MVELSFAELDRLYAAGQRAHNQQTMMKSWEQLLMKIKIDFVGTTIMKIVNLLREVTPQRFNFRFGKIMSFNVKQYAANSI